MHLNTHIYAQPPAPASEAPVDYGAIPVGVYGHHAEGSRIDFPYGHLR